MAPAWPAMFVAVTRTSMRCPASNGLSTYEEAVAFLIPLHDVPADEQRSHRYANFGEFDHVPWMALSFFPTLTVPAIVGSVLLAGASGTQ